VATRHQTFQNTNIRVHQKLSHTDNCIEEL
jgi:hypothetical protein